MAADRVKARLDPSRSAFITILGKKGSGKSFLARRFWDDWPFDALAIDPHAELDDPEARTFRGEAPFRWPAPPPDLEPSRRTKLRYVPDPGSKGYRDDLDRAVGLAFNRRRCLCWIDEVADLTRANSTPAYMRRALHQGRHRALTLLMCGPRAVDIDPLVISQADYVYAFDLPHPLDRERVAAVIGYPPKDFDAAVRGLGRHEYLRWDGEQLLHFDKLPERARMDREQRFATP